MAPQTAAAGEWVTLEIAHLAASGPAPVAIQWELEIPTAGLDLEAGPLTRASLAVKDVGKSVTCAIARKTAGRLLLPCILAGSQKPIPGGTIVIVSLKTGPRAELGTVRIRLQNGIGVTADLKATPIESTESTLTIRAR